jgi:hypothetical protein
MWYVQKDISSYLDEIGNQNITYSGKKKKPIWRVPEHGLYQNALFLETRNFSLVERWKVMKDRICTL